MAAEVERFSREVADRLGFSESGFLVLVNGGRRQDVRQTHFHLLTDGYQLARAPEGLEPGVWIDSPHPAGEVHQVRTGDRPLLAGLTHAVETQSALRLDARGYSIVWDARRSQDAGVVHLAAGRAK